MKLKKEIEIAINILKSAGYEALLVGGAVRDMLLNVEPNDFDMTTNALPLQIENVFKDYQTFSVGKKFGTITVKLNNIFIEITTYRSDGLYLDSRHPSEVVFSKSLQNDLSRRDFTINSLAVGENLKIIDYFEGIQDLKNKIIKTVGEPEKRFKEDALRILRAIRFASTLGFEIDDLTKKAMFEQKNLLKNISSERIFEELKKTLMGKNIKKVLIEYIEILAVFMPELLPMKNFEQHSDWHKFDVLTHTAISVEMVKSDLICKFTMLFHDSGKPEVFVLDKNLKGHFYGHQKISKKIADEILLRLKAPTDFRKQVTSLVECHDDYILCDEFDIKQKLSKYGVQFFDLLFEVQKADCFAQCLDTEGLKKFDKIKSIENKILENKNCISIAQLKINGSDLIELGFSGKQIGNILSKSLQAVLKNEIENDKDSLTKFIKSEF